MMDTGIKKVVIEDVRVFRGQIKGHPLTIEYDFNKEGYKDETSGERFYLVRAHYNGKGRDGLEYLCLVKFRCYTDEDYSKMKAQDAVAKLTKRLNAKYYDPENGMLRLLINDAVRVMIRYTDKAFAYQEANRKGNV